MHRQECYKYVQIKCRLDRLCIECQTERRKRLYGKIAEKLEKSGIGNNVRLWTFGTSLRDSRENRIQLQSWCTKFRLLMHKYNYRRALFRVTEAGSKRGLLHIHLLYSGYILHNWAKTHWRRLTGESSNVNLSSHRGNAKKAINYVLKYMTKGSSTNKLDVTDVTKLRKYKRMAIFRISPERGKKMGFNVDFFDREFKVDYNRVNIRYSWLGLWYKIPFDVFEAVGCVHGEPWKWYCIIVGMSKYRPGSLNIIQLNPP